MQTALAGFRLFPPPAARALIFPGLDRAGARRAADARESLIMQLVVRHFMSGDVVPDLLARPVRQRIDLDDAAVLRVDFYPARLGAGDRLLAAHTGHPGIQTGECPFERLHFADATAQLALLDGIVKKIHDVLPHHFFDSCGVGKKYLDLDAVARADRFHAIVGFLVEPAGVQSKEPKGGAGWRM